MIIACDRNEDEEGARRNGGSVEVIAGKGLFRGRSQHQCLIQVQEHSRMMHKTTFVGLPRSSKPSIMSLIHETSQNLGDLPLVSHAIITEITADLV